MKGEEFYSRAYEHLHSEFRDENLWAWCLAHHGMDEQRASATYIKRMAEYLEKEEMYQIMRLEEAERLAEAEREEVEQEERIARLREAKEQRLEHKRALEEEERSTLVFLKPTCGFLLFSLLGFMRSWYGDSGTFGMVWAIVVMGIFGASLFSVVRCMLVQQYRPTFGINRVHPFIMVLIAGFSGLLTYYLVW